MCIIIALPELSKIQKEIDYKLLEYSWSSNPDGAGFSYVEDVGTEQAKVVIKKGWFKLKHFMKQFDTDRQNNPDSKFMIHFRYATKGKVNASNCHPFYVVKNEISLSHNGTIYDVDSSDEHSDSKKIAELMKTLYDDDIPLDSPVMSLLIEKFIGTSKIVLLRRDNTFHFYNKQNGEQVDDIWYSNSYYKSKRIVTTQYHQNNIYNSYKKCGSEGCMNSLFLPIEIEMGYCIKCIGDTADECWDCGKKLHKAVEIRNRMCLHCLTNHSYKGGTV